MGSAMMTKRAKHVPKAKFASAACVMLQTGLAENANPTNSASITPVPIPKMATETVEMETVKTAETETETGTAETETAETETVKTETAKTVEMETAKTVETTPKPAIPVVR